MCPNNFSLVLMGGWVKGQVCAGLGAPADIFLLVFLNCHPYFIWFLPILTFVGSSKYIQKIFVPVKVGKMTQSLCTHLNVTTAKNWQISQLLEYSTFFDTFRYTNNGKIFIMENILRKTPWILFYMTWWLHPLRRRSFPL